MKINTIKIVLLAFVLFPICSNAQDKPQRFNFEAGLTAGISVGSCPGQYVSLSGEVAGPLSLYTMVETFQCQDFRGSAYRVGPSLRLGASDWIIRPELRTGIEYDAGDVLFTYGTSLSFGGKYGARLSLLVIEDISLVQLGAYIKF